MAQLRRKRIASQLMDMNRIIAKGQSKGNRIQMLKRRRSASGGIVAPAGAVDQALGELDAVFEWISKAKIDDREEEIACSRELSQRLGVFLDISIQQPIQGEPVQVAKFTQKYKSLSAASKIRLLGICRREEVALDLIQNYFPVLSDYHRIQLLKVSPIKQIPIAAEIWKDFTSMSPQYRSAFIDSAPVEFLSDALLKSLNLLTIGESLQILRRLPMNVAAFRTIKRTVCNSLWSRKSEFEYPQDFLDFASSIESENLSIKCFSVIEEMYMVARKRERLLQEFLHKDKSFEKKRKLEE